MNNLSRKLLKNAMEVIPETKRTLNPSIFHLTEQKALLRLAINLLENNDTITLGDIKSVCEEIGGDKYNLLIKNEFFEDNFAYPVSSRVDDMKNIIDLYRRIIHE